MNKPRGFNYNKNLGPRPTCFEPGSKERRALNELNQKGWIKNRSLMLKRERLRASFEECERKKSMWDRNEARLQTKIDDYTCKKCGQHCQPGDMYHPRGHCLKTD